MKNRKGKIDLGIKNCKKCHGEYLEKNNFKWSCNYHLLDWGGEKDNG